MKLCLALSTIVVLTLEGCASTGAPTPVAAPAAPTLETVNEALDDRVALVTLTGGEVIRARLVTITPEVTTFLTGRGNITRRVPTAEVQTVTVLAKRRVGRGLGAGLLVGAVVGLLSLARDRSGDDDDTGLLLAAAAPSIFITTTAAGGVIGAVIGATASLPEELVYETPIERYLAGSAPAAGGPAGPEA